MNDTNQIARTIEEGLATQEDMGLALRAITTQLSCNLVKTMTSIQGGVDRLQVLMGSLLNKFEEKVQVALEADTLTQEDLFTMIKDIQGSQLRFADLYRKIVQSSKGIFPEDLISEEEKKVVKLFKSFKTPEEKQKFLQICQEHLNEVETFE